MALWYSQPVDLGLQKKLPLIAMNSAFCATFVKIFIINTYYTMIKYILAFGMPGGWELVIIVFIVLLFFGAKRIPSLARSIGRGIREFKAGAKEVQHEIEDAAKHTDPKTNTSSK